MSTSINGMSPFYSSASLLDKMGLGKGSKSETVFLRFLSLHEMQDLRKISASQKEQVGTEQCAQALKSQLESKGTASFSDLKTYQKLANAPLSSSAISRLILSPLCEIQTGQLAAHPMNLLNFKSLNAAWCSQLKSDDFRHVVVQCPNLQSLNITRCPQLTGSDLRYASDRCPHLQSLSIVACTQLTGEDLRYIAEQRKGLHSLDIQGCRQFTGGDVRYVADKCPGLLHITWCTQLTGDDLRYIVDKCLGLQSLNIQGCSQLVGNDLRFVANKCPGLQSLDIQGCSPLTGDDVRYIADNCPGLVSLNIAWCIQLTGDDLRYIVTKCLGLQSLNIEGCNQFTNDDIRYVMSQCRDLQRIVKPKGQNMQGTLPPRQSSYSQRLTRNIAANVGWEYKDKIAILTAVTLATLCFGLNSGMTTAAGWALLRKNPN